MATSLHWFDPTLLEVGPLAQSLEAPEYGPRRLEVSQGSMAVHLWVVRFGSGFALLGAPDIRVNRCAIQGVWPLLHGDVVSVGPVHLVVIDSSEELWLPASIETDVLTAGASSEALAVAFDALRAAGHPGRPLGQLKTLQGRGLEVVWNQGFAVQLELRVGEPMFRAWGRRWFRLIGSTPALRFTQSITLTDDSSQPHTGLELAVFDLVVHLGESLPQLERLRLSPGFMDVGEDAGRALARLSGVRVEIAHLVEPVPEAYTNEWSETGPLKLFDAPAPSSWFNQQG
jgi:hypothetical protein